MGREAIFIEATGSSNSDEFNAPSIAFWTLYNYKETKDKGHEEAHSWAPVKYPHVTLIEPLGEDWGEDEAPTVIAVLTKFVYFLNATSFVCTSFHPCIVKKNPKNF